MHPGHHAHIPPLLHMLQELQMHPGPHTCVLATSASSHVSPCIPMSFLHSSHLPHLTRIPLIPWFLLVSPGIPMSHPSHVHIPTSFLHSSHLPHLACVLLIFCILLVSPGIPMSHPSRICVHSCLTSHPHVFPAPCISHILPASPLSPGSRHFPLTSPDLS